MCKCLLGSTCAVLVAVVALLLKTELYYYLPFPTCRAGDRCLHCAAGKPDSCKDVPTFASEYMNPVLPQWNFDLVKGLYLKRLDRKEKANESFNILYIGPNTFDAEAEFLGSAIPDERKHMTKMIIVEPLLGVHADIKKHAADNGFVDATVVHAAIGVRPNTELSMWWYESACTDAVIEQLLNEGIGATTEFAEWKSNLTLYLSRVTTFSEGKLRRYLQDPRESDVRLQVLFPNWLIGSKTFPFQFLQAEFEAATGGSDAQYQELRKRLQTCVEPMSVPIVSPAELLAKHGLTPGSLDVVYCDAEGYDVEIMREVMKLEGYKPFFQMVEWAGYPACCDRHQLLQLVRNMSIDRYDVYQSNQDFVGVLDESLW